MATISSDVSTFVAIGRWSSKIRSLCLERAMLTGSRLLHWMANKVLVGDRHLTIARSLSSKWIKYSSCPNCDWLQRDLFNSNIAKEFLAVTWVYSRLWNTWLLCWIRKNLDTGSWGNGRFPPSTEKVLYCLPLLVRKFLLERSTQKVCYIWRDIFWPRIQWEISCNNFEMQIVEKFNVKCSSLYCCNA